MEEQRYLFETSKADSEIRFQALSELYDPRSLQRMERLGLSAGWHCWEVGPGGGAMPLALAERVGPEGRVLATFISTWGRKPLS